MWGSWLLVISAVAPLELEVAAPGGVGCHDSAKMRFEITRHLGSAQTAQGDVPLSAQVTLRSQAGKWRLQLAMTGAATGERVLEGDTCAEVSEAAELIIALAIDPQAVADQQAVKVPEPAPPQTPVAPKPVPPPAAPKPVAPPPPSQPPVQISLGAAAGLDVGTLPNVGPAVQFAALLQTRRWLQLRLDLELLFPSTAKGARDGTGGRISVIDGGLRGGVMLLREPIDLVAELGVRAGVMQGEGYGLDVPLRGSDFWAAATAGASVAYRFNARVSVRLGIEAGVTLRAPRFAIDGVGTVHRASTVFARAWLGPEVAFQ